MAIIFRRNEEILEVIGRETSQVCDILFSPETFACPEGFLRFLDSSDCT
jgi:hypothetical protein